MKLLKFRERSGPVHLCAAKRGLLRRTLWVQLLEWLEVSKASHADEWALGMGLRSLLWQRTRLR